MNKEQKIAKQRYIQMLYSLVFRNLVSKDIYLGFSTNFNRTC